MHGRIEDFIYFEQLCVKLFKNLGFKVIYNEYESILNKNLSDCDFILEKNNQKIVVDVKFYKTKKPDRINLLHAEKQLNDACKRHQANNKLLIINCRLDSSLFDEFKERNEIDVLTAENLLFLSKENTTLYNDYVLILNSSVIYTDRNKEEEPKISYLENLSIETKYDLDSTKKECSCKELLDIEVSKGTIYEKKCTEILKCLFIKDLSRWSEQERTDDDISRFDLVCRVNKNKNAFWDLIVDEFNSRYVVFEFKNYKDQIKQTQIYTTEKYLFKRALRNVAFIISRKGADDNAIKVTKGILRETGKLIINLTDEDLCKMLKMKESGDEPSDLLFEIIDDFLLKMEK